MTRIWFCDDPTYNYQTIRAFSHVPYGGGEAGEILAAIKDIKEGDIESWYRGWDQAARRVEQIGCTAQDTVSRGRALLRAHNYYRTAEFLLYPGDPRRVEAFRKNVTAFNDGLDALGIERETIDVPYGEYRLKAVSYPGPSGSEAKPLIVACGGYDSTMEELYFIIVAAALERGYSALIYEGPGQGSILREQGLVFTHEWEKPNTAVLDEFLKNHRKPDKIVLYGLSLGGYLAPRAAMHDDRIDGIILNNMLYDMQEAAFEQVPGFAGFLHKHGFDGILNSIVKLKMKTTPGVRWGVKNTEWAMGTKTPVDAFNAFARYSLRGIAENIKCDVLILAAEKDHMIPLKQASDLEKELVNARSVTVHIFANGEGAQEHCEFGAITQSHEVIFDWIEHKFGGTA
ncbi:MAG: alpha/beta fold hydrolase [Candidatus Abyssobacteria bacterium SURF_17]|uniref:Alpha/beta fold hydrolase n=1 Tax=Candidatus Abyssobacteria bacterium SURF_17 TaxID=2093361 RepID=A0A419ES32_9BACT|nr:MAG: alpha/beta fold hydrolase [Candidatus Abyssubacteria bacterium SURF_17]